MTQNEAMEVMGAGWSVLVTGPAGTGKTYLLEKFINKARSKGKVVAVTATTGLAATHLSGTTIHSWSAIGVRDKLDEYFFKKMPHSRKDKIKKADILVIDEISMFHDFRLDMVEEVTRTIRGINKPFGGLQVILCGDFFQLPPINTGEGRRGGIVTSSDTWRAGHFSVCYLEKQYRQSGDEEFQDILNSMRAGKLSEQQILKLEARKKVDKEQSADISRLLTLNIDVDWINSQRLEALKTKEHAYEMTSLGDEKYIKLQKKSCLAPQTLKLKRGAVVMFVKNSPDGSYINGSIGTVVHFLTRSRYPVVKLKSGKRVTVQPESWEMIENDVLLASLTQLPLRLAWAITVHKSQGMTLDEARIDLGKAFMEGMGYVALSRVRNLESLTLDDLNDMSLRTSPIARSVDRELQRRSKATLEAYLEFEEELTPKSKKENKTTK